MNPFSVLSNSLKKLFKIKIQFLGTNLIFLGALLMVAKTYIFSIFLQILLTKLNVVPKSDLFPITKVSF